MPGVCPGGLYSLPSIKALRKYAQENNHRVVAEFIDEAFIRDIDNRMQLEYTQV